PKQKKYYAAFAGNEKFPLTVFDAKGKRLSGDELNCMVDIRGLWYNPKSDKICGNGYADIGWICYNLDSKGIPQSYDINISGTNQPGDNCIGVYNSANDMLCFLDGENVYAYNSDALANEDNSVRLYPGISHAEDIDEYNDGSYLSESYNSNVLIYTGIIHAEFGLLNVVDKQVELYDGKTGLLTQKLKLPSNVQTYPLFNFSYANGIYWAFDQENRTWFGYK
ncbi:MAG: hypothetical protein WCL06_12355, partial [Bacteroidota bacterium]